MLPLVSSHNTLDIEAGASLSGGSLAFGGGNLLLAVGEELRDWYCRGLANSSFHLQTGHVTMKMIQTLLLKIQMHFLKRHPHIAILTRVIPP